MLQYTLPVCCGCVWCRYSEALQFYEEALQAKPSSAVLWKRKVAVLKATGDTAKAIAELNALLKV